MYVMTSNDGGKSFSDARKLGAGTWQLDACPMDGGMLATGPNGALATVWRRDGNVFAAAGDGSPEILLGPGQQPWIAGTSQGSAIVWTAGREGDLLVHSTATAKSLKLADAARDPVIASSAKGDGPVIACWESKLNGKSSVMAARITVAGTSSLGK